VNGPLLGTNEVLADRLAFRIQIFEVKHVPAKKGEVSVRSRIMPLEVGSGGGQTHAGNCGRLTLGPIVVSVGRGEAIMISVWSEISWSMIWARCLLEDWLART
jgi:hypothetical protein